MHIRRHRFWTILVSALTLATLGWLLGTTQIAHADEITVCPAGPGTCDHATIQEAVDAAQDGDVIKIAAGQYIDLHIRPRQDISATGHVTQVVYISKSLTLRGGYTTSFTDPPDPIANPTILDAGGGGRAVYITGAISPTLEGLQFTNGDASGLGGGGSPGSVQDSGGGLYVITATATLSRCQAFSNTATLGGGVLLYRSDATVANSRVFSNTATQNGGGVYLFESDAILYTDIITHNLALNDGGGIYLNKSEATLSSNTVSTNTANHYGGGAHLDFSAAKITDNDWTANAAGSVGGGLYLISSAAKVKGNNFSFNDAGRSGGGLRLTSSGGAILSHNTVFSNTANNWGGGLYMLGCGGISLYHNTVRANTSGGDGGGLYLNTSAATLDKNVIVENRAETNGGALFAESSSTTFLYNNIIADNQANGAGSGLYVKSTNITLQHNTIAHNLKGDGVGLFTDRAHGEGGNDVTFENTILVSHTTGISVTQEGYTVTMAGTLWGEGAWVNGQNWGGAGHVTHTLDYTGTPDFVAPEAGDYHIGLSSAAINRAVDLGTDHDVDGQARPQGSGYEIGADETGLLVTKVATPTALHSGEALTYTIRVTNTSNVTLNATITDVMPITVTPSAPPTGWSPGDPLTWTTEITAPGGVWMQPVTVTVNPAYTGTLDNVVHVSTEQGPTGVTTSTVEVGITRALVVGQRVRPDPVQAGGKLSITLYVTNVGNIALNTIVTETLPQHMQRGIVDGQPVDPGDTLSWETGPLTPTHTWQKSFSIKVAWGYSGTVTNRVQAKGIGGGEDDHVATVAAQVTPSLDFDPVIRPDPVQAGERMTYTLSIRNTGNVTLTATVTDTLPDQVTTTDQTAWHGQVIARGGWVERIAVTVVPTYSGLLTNVVTIVTEEGVGGVYTQTTESQLVPALNVVKRASTEQVAAGERLTYTIRVTNTGNMDLHATITDDLPEHVTTDSPTTWEDQFLPAWGVPWQRTVVVTTALGYEGPLTNIVYVTTEEGATGSYSVTSQSLVTPALQIAKHADGTSVVAPGELFSYTLVYSNTGTGPASNVIIQDQLPDAVTFKACSGCTENNGLVTWNRGTVLPDTSSSVTVQVEARLDSGGQTAINADYRIQSDELSSSETLSGAPVTIQILNPNLQLGKTASLEFFGGADETIVYTITYKNSGSGALTGVVITDALPANTRFQKVSPSSQCTHSGSDTDGVVTCAIGTLAQGESGTVQIEVLTGSGETNIINQAEGDSDQTSPKTSSVPVMYNDGCFEIIQAGIQVSDLPAGVGQTVHFTGTYTPTLANDTRFGGPVTFNWDFDGPDTASGTDGQTETCTYDVAGTYMVTLTVNNNCNVPVSDTQRVNVISGENPDIALIDDVFVSLAPGKTDQHTLTIHNVGGTTLHWALSEPPTVDWLNVTPTQGSVASSAKADVTLYFDANGLSEGDYSTTLEITGDPDESPVTVTINLRVTEEKYEIYLPLVFKGSVGS